MESDVYGSLMEHLEKISFGSEPVTELRRLIEELFTEEEARVALNLSPFFPEPPSNVAKRMGEPEEKISSILDTMADKGLIYCSERKGDKWYKVIQLVPGVFELQFMKGEVSDRTKRLARLFDDYFRAAERAGTGEEVVPFARVLPVEKTVASRLDVFPYEEARRYIEAADAVSLSTCYCRHERRLLGKGCGFPDDVCLQFGAFARFIIQRGFGREISREQAMEVLERSREAGLVHTSNNTRDHIDFICNCCGCCCGILRSVRSSTVPSMATTSNYQASVQQERCTGCGECVESCHMDAVSMRDEKALISIPRCIGCGVCVTRCPSGALSMVERARRMEPPRDFRELVSIQMARRMSTKDQQEERNGKP
jgi:ferredoxin